MVKPIRPWPSAALRRAGALPNGVAAPTDRASPPDPRLAELHPRMVPIPSGRFPDGQHRQSCPDDEQPQHEVRITVPFLPAPRSPRRITIWGDGEGLVPFRGHFGMPRSVPWKM